MANQSGGGQSLQPSSVCRYGVEPRYQAEGHAQVWTRTIPARHPPQALRQHRGHCSLLQQQVR